MNKKQQLSDEEKLLTAAELSQRWNGIVSVPVLANWRSLEKGPSFTKIGGKPMYSLAAIREYESKNTHVIK